MYYKEWHSYDVYNFSIEFNRLESYNLYVDNWLRDYFGGNYDILEHKTNWTYSDIVDLKDYNRVGSNINYLYQVAQKTMRNDFSYTNYYKSKSSSNTKFDESKAQQLELYSYETLKIIGELQFKNQITGFAICGSDNRLMGV